MFASISGQAHAFVVGAGTIQLTEASIAAWVRGTRVLEYLAVFASIVGLAFTLKLGIDSHAQLSAQHARRLTRAVV